MNIALCTDNNYVMPCMITIASFLHNHRNDRCKVFVLTTSGGGYVLKISRNLKS